MKKTYNIVAVIFILLSLLVAWLMNMDIISFNKEISQKNTALEQAGNECVAIAEKSVSHLVAVVEFQKLEIVGRKARVMRNCMDDHAYIQNPAWTAYANPIAEKTAANEKVSVDEAFENLRRQDMVIFTPKENTPLYWIASNKK